MINGRVYQSRRPLVEINVIGKSHIELTLEAVVDSGFTEYLTLTSAQIKQLGLEYDSDTTIKLADGSIIQCSIYIGKVIWENRELTIFIHASEGECLLGASMLYGSRLTVDFVEDGQVTIESLS